MTASRVAGLLIAMVLLAGCGNTPAPAPQRDSVTPRLPPVAGVFDYQLGGAYDTAGLAVVVRDESATPLPGAYNICYVNGFQTQPGTGDEWLTKRPSALLRDADGSPVVDPDWPDEFVLDPSTPAQRAVILDVMGPLITDCARSGYDAVEVDNFDTFTRFDDRIDEGGALALARSYASLAHGEGLAIGQKNAAASTEMGRREIGFDFAVAEECAAYDECASYSRAYGRHVLQVEYTDNLPVPFRTVCEAADRAPLTILRDRDLVPRDAGGYVYAQCP